MRAIHAVYASVLALTALGVTTRPAAWLDKGSPEAAGADTVLYAALKAGDYGSPKYWRQDVPLVGDQTMGFLAFSSEVAADSGHPQVVRRVRVDSVDGHPAYELTLRFQIGPVAQWGLADTARVGVLAVNYGTNGGWKLGNVLELRTATWRIEHVGPLAIHLPQGAVLPPEWKDAAWFADSLAHAYGVTFPADGLTVYAAPSVARIVGVDAQTRQGGWIAYYEPRSDWLIAPLMPPKDAPKVLRHEIAHAVLRRGIGPLSPSWAMDEGAATYYGGGYGCASGEAFIRQMGDGIHVYDEDVDLATAHALDRHRGAAEERIGLLGGILATALADSTGGPRKVLALMKADALDLAAGADGRAPTGFDGRIRHVLGVRSQADRALDIKLLAFGYSRALHMAMSKDSALHARAAAWCANDLPRSESLAAAGVSGRAGSQNP